MRLKGETVAGRDVGRPAMKPVSRAEARRNEAAGSEAVLASGVGSPTSCVSAVSLFRISVSFCSPALGPLGSLVWWHADSRSNRFGREVALPGARESDG